ncbi:SMP-30/gluconolactonase/LRE family protein [Glacieibacterium frigidum]|uniref:SMP-30/gluconolactonase/LRE family protein n=1 Tax=Glacieibacterium frigidum TaxID=2593303 RepID=A0A552UGI5_9SPHN|nr:SMP-30/gluconolactonase/LRE family protein [Glacieibacterium frigidum]TRW17332.1 SMP-30/gluconolactonase/LRE family protein [Glacieibacterium frigidum]
MTPRLTDAPVAASGATPTGRFRGFFGESAVWSSADGGVWWVDMHGHALVLTAADGTTHYWKTPGPHLPWARAVVLRERGGLIVALSDGLAAFDPAAGTFTTMPLDLTLPPGHLFNDATVDSHGRLIIGTMLPGRGNDARAAIYGIDADLSVRVLVDGLNTTNGLAFSPDGRTLYFSDSFADVRKVWAAPYDPATGTMGAARLFVDFANLPGKPDGATIDSEGGYWSAAMASPYLHRFMPDGRLDRSLELPVDTPTRPAFGGSNLRTLYLTTAGLKNGETDDGIKGGLLAMPAPFAGLMPTPTRI